MTSFKIVELEWPDKEPGDVLDYAVDMSGDLASGEAITRVVVAIKPSGAGELAIGGRSSGVNVFAQDAFAVVWLNGGVPGRTYLVRVFVMTNQERTYDHLVTLRVDDTLAASPLPTPPSEDFGPAVAWQGTTFSGAAAVTGSAIVAARAS